MGGRSGEGEQEREQERIVRQAEAMVGVKGG